MEPDSTTTSVYVLPRQMPAGLWHRLVRALVSKESWFGLVWRDQLEWSQRARGVRELLQPLAVDQRRADRWPGTRLSDSQATVIVYRTSPRVLPLLLSTDSPFDWLSPDLPEDLFFGSGDSELALVTVTHERDGWLLKRRYAQLLGSEATLRKERLSSRDRLLLLGSFVPPKDTGR